MKKVVFILVVLFNASLTLGQSERTQTVGKLKYGFNLGISHSNLLGKDQIPDIATLSNNPGFHLGFIAAYKVSELLSISPKAEIAFHDAQVEFENPGAESAFYEAMQTTARFAAHFVFGQKSNGLTPFFFLGPAIGIPVAQDTEFDTKTNFALDFGIGFDKPLTKFHLMPALRYSFGLSDVNGHPAIESLNFHNVSLVFNFIG